MVEYKAVKSFFSLNFSAFFPEHCFLKVYASLKRKEKQYLTLLSVLLNPIKVRTDTIMINL